MSGQGTTGYAPGTLAYATVRGATELAPTLVHRHRDGIWQTFEDVNGFHLHVDEQVTDVRPLVVLDVGTASYAATALEASSDNGDLYCAKQIRDAMPRPPKPPEPTGLGAVVEDAEGFRWLRVAAAQLAGSPRRPWRKTPNVNKVYHQWQDVDAVRVLSEGVPTPTTY